ncbi:MAG: sulfatase-like hydrolase/transferase [Ignavibacteriaceae bacterium]|nr:sulfatase-like hydrolase/transferase [Ignavibacteriaceae bacterium]
MITLIPILKNISYRAYAAYLLPVFVILFDILFRTAVLKEFSNDDYFFYGVSVIYEILIFVLIFKALKYNKYLPSILTLLYIVVSASAFAFYSYFRTLPGINTFSFIFASPANSIAIVKAQLNPLYLFIALALSAGVIYSAVKYKDLIVAPGKKVTVILFLFFVTLTLILHNNLRLKDNRSLPFTNVLFSLKHGYFDYLNNAKIVQIGGRTFAIREKQKNLKADFNVIFIMSESVSPFYMMEYGGKYITDSSISSRMLKEPDNFYSFSDAYTNSTVTAVSVPFSIAGLNPVQGKYKLIGMPLIYDYLAHHYTNVSSSYITSWSYDDYPNFKAFFDSPSLDTYIYREKFDDEKVVDMGGDDALITERFSSYLDSRPAGKRFFSLLHYSNTHYPHYSPDSGKVYDLENSLLSDYLNSLRYFDRNLEDLFKVLEERNELEKTIIFFTTDHSESLGEYSEERGHHGKYNIWKIKIPMWIYIPAQLQKRFSVKQLSGNTKIPVSNSDIVPTIFDLYKIPAHKDFEHGSSLMNTMDKQRNIYIYNGKGENRSEMKDYLGILKDTLFYIATKNSSGVKHELFSVYDTLQAKNLYNSFSKGSALLRTAEGTLKILD